jgi:glycosyltransferase involved in cell wall biosynthesis
MDLKRVIGEVGPDLIHAGPIQTCAFLTILSAFRPVLTMSWGFDLMQDAERNAWWRWVTRYTLQRSTFFTSDALVTRAKAISYGMNPDRTVVFPWGVNLKTFRPSQSPKKRGIGGDRGGRRKATLQARVIRSQPEFVILCNRSWEPRYGVDVLSRAFVRAAQVNPDIGLILLGGGSQAKSIREILTRGGMLGRVQFGGRVPQAALPRWYRKADLFVSPSHVDGSSVSLMEALACGLPALVSDIPANKEWVREDANGWLFPDGNAQALADKILAVVANRHKLARISLAARKTAEERADWSKNFPILLSTYEETIQLKGTP